MGRVLVAASVIVLIPLIMLSWVAALLFDYYTVPVKYEGPSHPNGDVAPFPSDTNDNLWWYIQISDIHISRFRDPARTTDFQKFCKDNIHVIKPPLVLVTGDLTDAKTIDFIGSTQYEIEWQTYQSAIKLANAHEKTKWLDIRGNHDAFDVPHVHHENNFYRKYSIVGHEGDSSFIYQHKLPFGTYSFVSLYAILNPGPRRPFNFFGILSEDELDKIKSNSLQVSGSNHTVFFGHYPTSTIYAEKPGLADVLQNGIAYICGHLHSLGGLVRNMHAVQRSGNLELEVEDWKENRMYRVMAFDHDIMSFVDVKFEQWPVILITNPKRARFLAPKHEPINKMLHSTHIRFLVFSPSQITSTQVFVDGISLGAAKHVEGPLFVIPWDPQQYKEGLHHISVTAVDESGSTTTSEYHFSIDGSRPDQWFVPAVLLMSDMIHVILLLYVVHLCVATLPLIIIRWTTRKGQERMYSYVILRGCMKLAHSDLYFKGLMFLAFYPLIGPWAIGEFVGNHIGVSTMYGIYINGTFVGELFSYAVLFLDMTLFQIFFTMFLILKLGLKDPSPVSNGSISNSGEVGLHSRTKSSFLIHSVSYALLVLPVQWQIYSLKTLYYGYGFIALIISPKFLWSSVFILYLAYKVHKKEVSPVVMNGSHKS